MPVFLCVIIKLNRCFVESIRIEEQPSSQKQKEGSRVELRCKIQGRNDVTYQWLKDGEELKGQNSSTLVLNLVKLCDFGFYVCKVRCTDNSASSICVESSPAELNVTPQDGRSTYTKIAFSFKFKRRLRIH